LENIKNTLAHWNDNSERFEAKLVAREETGCCEAGSSMDPNTGTADGPKPCDA